MVDIDRPSPHGSPAIPWGGNVGSNTVSHQRSSEVPFFTLGVASCIDSCPRVDSYYALVMRENPILRENFAWLYERVIDALANHLDGPISREHDRALPGFHLYLIRPSKNRSLRSISIDNNIACAGANPTRLSGQIPFRSHFRLPFQTRAEGFIPGMLSRAKWPRFTGRNENVS